MVSTGKLAASSGGLIRSNPTSIINRRSPLFILLVVTATFQPGQHQFVSFRSEKLNGVCILVIIESSFFKILNFVRICKV